MVDSIKYLDFTFEEFMEGVLSIGLITNTVTLKDCLNMSFNEFKFVMKKTEEISKIVWGNNGTRRS